jgi:3-hydroxyisobutyrate dehydrogenase-like beta-hydroxyacid dehydrogenase
LRLDAAGVFGRIKDKTVCLDMRTLTDAQVRRIAEAIGRAGERE